MNAFHFRLEKVLEWRRTQLELEEARYKQQAAVLAQVDRARADLQAAGVRAEIEVRNREEVAGRELQALANFRQHIHNREHEMARQRAVCERALAERQTAMLEARRRCRLLERLRERRLAEWKAELDKELDALASESYLARWSSTL